MKVPHCACKDGDWKWNAFKKKTGGNRISKCIVTDTDQTLMARNNPNS